MRKLAVVPFLLSLLTTCGSDSKPDVDASDGDVAAEETVTPDLSLVPLSGTVALPPGSAIALADLQVVSAVDSASVGADGTFTLDRIGAGEDPAQLVFAVGPGDKPVLAGWLDSQHATLSARTTAEVLAWYATGTFLLPIVSQPDALKALRTYEDVAPLATAIATELGQNPNALVGPSPAIEAALEDFVRLVQDVPEVRSITSPLVLVDPAQPRSGVRVDQPPGVNTIQLVNSYRRRGYVYVDRVSYVDANDHVVDAPQRVTDHYLAASTGLNGAIGTFIDIFNGNYAYTPTPDEQLVLPWVDDAKKTTYRVTLVGLGARLGDVEKLTSEQRDKLTWVTYVTGFWDVLLPLVVNVILPVATYGGADGILDDIATSDVITDVLNIIATMPGAKDALAAGKLKEFVHIVFAHVTTGNAVLQKRLVAASIDFVFQLQLAHAISDDNVMAFNRALGYAGQILNGLNVVNIISGSVDFGVVAAHIGASDLADVWRVEVLPPEVKIAPAEATVRLTEELELEAIVPEATGSGDETRPTFAYHWSHVGNGGTLADTRGHSGDDFESSDAKVTFTADGVAGDDTITVEVTWVKMGDGPTERITLGEATAKVTVKESIWNAAADFSGTANPNGTWSSGWAVALGDFFEFSTTFVGACGSAVWVPESGAGTPSFWKNLCSDVTDGVAPDQVSLHPGCSADEFAILRWEAPQAGRYDVEATFYYGDHGGEWREPYIGDTDAYVLRDGATQQHFATTDTNPKWVGIMSLEAGAMIDFVVGTKGECGFDNTPLDVIIHATTQ